MVNIILILQREVKTLWHFTNMFIIVVIIMTKMT